MYDIIGRCHSYGGEMLNFMRANTNLDDHSCYAASGGNVIYSAMLHRAENITDSFIDAMYNATTRGYLASDEVLSAVILKAGGTIGRMNGYADSMFTTEDLVVRHDMKMLYDNRKWMILCD